MRRTALIDHSGARHSRLSAALTKWLETIWPSVEWNQWVTVHYHPVSLIDSAPLTIFKLDVWLNGHVGAWATPDMASTLHQWLTHLIAPTTPLPEPDSSDAQRRLAADGPLIAFDEWILAGPRTHFLRPLSLKLARGSRPIAHYMCSTPQEPPLPEKLFTILVPDSQRLASATALHLNKLTSYSPWAPTLRSHHTLVHPLEWQP